VATVLREEFIDEHWTSGKRSVTELPSHIDVGLGYQLGLFGALLATRNPAPPPQSLNFQFVAAEINDTGEVQIVQGDFSPKTERLGPFDLAAPSYELRSTSTIVIRFDAKAAGWTAVARAILSGAFTTQDDRILDYYRAGLAGNLDELSLSSLEDLAVAILEETVKVTPLVGGETQIGVFAKEGTVRWTLPLLATDRQKLKSTILRIGQTYTPDGLTLQEYADARRKKILTTMSLSLYQPFEQPLTQVFVGNRFRDVTVSLDGNVFGGNEFNRVRFKYGGGPIYLSNNSFIGSCTVEVPPETPVPPQLKRCEREPGTSTASAGYIGSPIRAQPTGCVGRNAEGKLILKTDGSENGKSCEKSGFVVPRIMP
jgi:hypothetical protein